LTIFADASPLNVIIAVEPEADTRSYRTMRSVAPGYGLDVLAPLAPKPRAMPPSLVQSACPIPGPEFLPCAAVSVKLR
jgi:hypothetical protein